MIHIVQFKDADSYTYTAEDGSFKEIPQYVFVYLLMNGSYYDQICAMRSLGSIYAVEAALGVAGTYANNGNEVIVWYDDDSLVPDRFDAVSMTEIQRVKDGDLNELPMIQEEDELNGFA